MSLFSLTKLMSKFKGSKKRSGVERKARLGCEALEKRDLMAGVVFNNVTGVLAIHGSNQDDVANVSVVGNQVKVSLTGYANVEPYLSFYSTSKSYSAAAVKEVKFFGYNGKDRFTNKTSIKSYADGGHGDDILNGGGGADFLVGNHGNDTLRGNGGDDTLWGSGGHDKLYGGTGRDLLKGHGGNDWLYGGANNDALYGGSGIDNLRGESGQDVIVSIGGGTDFITGGPQWDYVWMDSTDVMTDASPSEIALGYIHKVSQFMAYSFDGGVTSTAVSKELNGQDLAEPKQMDSILDGTQPSNLKVNVKANPLFASAGPTKDDVFQGAVGDCYFMAPLSAIAGTKPELIRNMVVDLGDGTYAVRFFRDGVAEYVRVDADLYVDAMNNLTYAGLGMENSIWVPIVEKAYAFFRRQLGDYDSIASGDGLQYGHLGVTESYKAINDGVTAEQVVLWFNNGSPDGALKNTIRAGVLDQMNWVQSQLDAGKAVILSARSGLSNMTAIQESNYRVGQHVYMIDSVMRNADGDAIGLRLRDPYGSYREITDFTRLYFCIKRAVAMDV